MTGFSEPHGAIPYSTEVLPPAELNTIVDNSRAQFLRTLGGWTVFSGPYGTQDSAKLRVPTWVSGWSTLLMCAAAAAADPILFSLTLNSTTNRYDWLAGTQFTALANAENLILSFVPSTLELVAFSVISSTNYYLVQSSGSSLASFAFDDSASFTCKGPICYAHSETPLDARWFVPGRKESDYPSVAVVSSAGAAVTLGVSPNSSGEFMTSIATDGEGLVVAVGGTDAAKAVAVSTDNGDSWTWAAYPTHAAALTTAHPCVAYDATRELFVTTIIDTSRDFNYCSSPDGTSWGAWHTVPTLGGSHENLFDVSAQIVIVGGTWIIAQPYHPQLNGVQLVRVFASYDGGSSWHDISPAQNIQLETTGTDDGFWMVEANGRVVIATTRWVAVSEPFDSVTPIASSLV